MTDTAVSMLSAIVEQEKLLSAKEQARDKAVADVAESLEQLVRLIREYNRERLHTLTDFLITKGLAYFSESRWQDGQLVKEAELHFVTKEGVEEVWRGGEYYSRTEMVPYKRTTFEHSARWPAGSNEVHEGISIRERWVSDFKDRFADTPNCDLPAWLLVAIDEDALPSKPIRPPKSPRK